jgi:homoserine dehydrogenase
VLIGPGVGVREGIVVLKFGSSVLRARTDHLSAVHEIYRWYRCGHGVIAVVSAIGDATNLLLTGAQDLAPEPEGHALAELLATGERASAALLAIALDRVGVRARVVDPRDIGLVAQGAVLDSEPVGVDREQLKVLLAEYPVLVVPGFFGFDHEQRLSLLGRGGSDLTAAFLASAVSATRCRLIKDVDGVYESDPAGARGSPPRRFVSLTYGEALAVAAPLIQGKAVRYLERRQRTAEVASLASPYESLIGSRTSELVQATATAPARVLLLGLGTVGGGVTRRLLSMPGQFRIVGAFVKSSTRTRGEGIPNALIQIDDEALMRVECDVVVDALPGLEPSLSLLRACLARGIHVVSGNKVVIADEGPKLAALAAGHGAQLSYSAAVGGSAPMIETVRRLASTGGIASISAILSGTCNFVLDECGHGVALPDAVREAQARGYAEADASEDLSGRDTARKLRILARHAFGREVDSLSVESIQEERLKELWSDLRGGQQLRLVGTASRLNSGHVEARVRLTWIGEDHPLSNVAGEWNALAITLATGETTLVTGRGAGRWPTTEAIIADLLELRRECQLNP